MRNLAFSLILSLFLVSCDKKEVITEMDLQSPEYSIAEDDPFYDIVFDPENHTFEALDDYYQLVKETRKDELRYDNLRRSIIDHIYLQNGRQMTGTPKEKVEYYVNEILSMEYISNMEILAHMLTKLSGYWSDEKIREISILAADRNLKFIMQNFDNPQGIFDLPHQANGMKLLRMFAHFKSNKE